MTAQELRIGNYVQDLVGAPCRVRAINEGGISIKGGGYSASVEMFKPIELTNDILSKCGFDVKFTNGGFIKWQKDDFKLIDRRLPYPLNYSARVVYLHQLQNLYFALTGEELTLK